jgi:hypothetical protein
MHPTLALLLAGALGWLPIFVTASVDDCLASLTFDQAAGDQLQLSQGNFRPGFSYNAAREHRTVD